MKCSNCKEVCHLKDDHSHYEHEHFYCCICTCWYVESILVSKWCGPCLRRVARAWMRDEKRRPGCQTLMGEDKVKKKKKKK